MVEDRVRIVHVDHFPLCRLGFRAAVEAHRDLHLVAEADDLESIAELVGLHRPGVLVAEADMPDMTACERAIEAIRRLGTKTHVMLLTRFRAAGYEKRAEAIGALGFMTKRQPVGTVLSAIRDVAAGRRVFANDVNRRGSGPSGDLDRSGFIESQPGPVLTGRELEIARMLALGMSVKEVAGVLHRSTKTIEAHKSHVMGKLNIHDRVQLARFAVREGWIDA